MIGYYISNVQIVLKPGLNEYISTSLGYSLEGDLVETELGMNDARSPLLLLPLELLFTLLSPFLPLAEPERFKTWEIKA